MIVVVVVVVVVVAAVAIILLAIIIIIVVVLIIIIVILIVVIIVIEIIVIVMVETILILVIPKVVTDLGRTVPRGVCGEWRSLFRWLVSALAHVRSGRTLGAGTCLEPARNWQRQWLCWHGTATASTGRITDIGS